VTSDDPKQRVAAGSSAQSPAVESSDHAGGEWVAGDDRAVGAAFRWSLAAFLGAAALVGGIWWIKQRTPPEARRPPEPAAAPESRVVPPPEALPVLPFANRGAALGVGFVRTNGAVGDKLLPETMGGGVAFFDYDGDGWDDLFFVDGSSWPDASAESRVESAGCRLYRNEAGKGFRDVTDETGAGLLLQGMGVACGDYDGDGHVDLFVTAVGTNALLRNVSAPDGGRRFENATVTARVAGDPEAWSSGAAFVDLDRDGDLDLVVIKYVKWTREIDFEVDFRLTGVGRAYGPPSSFEGTDSVVYRNEGDGTFTDVSAASGIRVRNPATGVPVGKGLAVAPVDLDGDGWIDLVVANDTTQNFAFRNLGASGTPGVFEEIGASTGLAFDRNGAATGAMGIDAADFRNDDCLAIAIGNFANEMTSFFVSRGSAPERFPFSDDAVNEGIGGPTRLVLSFGLFFFDADLDGRLDLLQCNGHIEDQIEVTQPSQRYAQSAQLFWNRGPAATQGASAAAAGARGSYVELPRQSLGDLSTPIVGRGAAYSDIDHDGDLDVVLTQPKGPPLVLVNEQSTENHWLRVGLRDPGSKNQFALGATVVLRAGGITQRRTITPTRSYLSQCELPVTFGLGTTEVIDSIEIIWPDGGTEIVALDRGVDRVVEVVRQGAGRSG